MSSSLSRPICPRTVQRQKKKRERGRPAECGGCDAGLQRNTCMSKSKYVVYSLRCAVCGEEYVSETSGRRGNAASDHGQAKNAT